MIKIKKWFKKNKYLLIVFGIVSIIFFILVYASLAYVLQPNVYADLDNYTKTGVITTSLTKYAILAFISLIFLVVWSILFSVVLWKIIFPSRQSVKDAFMYDNFKFIIDIPKNLKKGLNKHE